MRALIYGGGAVGLGLASCLLRSKAQVDIIARKKTVQSLRKSGLTRTGIFGDYRASPSTFKSYSSLDKVRKEIYDYILVCTKSFDSFEAAKDLSEHKSLLGQKAKIVLFQNGWGNAEIFLSFFDTLYENVLCSCSRLSFLDSATSRLSIGGIYFLSACRVTA